MTMVTTAATTTTLLITLSLLSLVLVSNVVTAAAKPRPAAAASDTDVEDLVAVVHITTGNAQGAQAAVRELERVGFGERFDHARTTHEIEAVMRHADLARLRGPHSPLLHVGNTDYGVLGDPDQWRVVRNLTAREPGVPQPVADPAAGGAGATYLPIAMGRYHNSREAEHILRALTRDYPEHASLRNLGRSSRGAVLWALKLTGRPTATPTASNWKGALLITGSPHGDDMLGREMCLWLAQHLCVAYGRVGAVRNLMDSVDIYLVPSPSPDASDMEARYTARGVDLDRAFPDRLEPGADPDLPEPELEALMDWARQLRPLASVSILGGGGAPGHGGLVVRYSWNGNLARVPVAGRPERAPDDRSFRYLARTYAAAHPTLSRADPRGKGPDAGTINGAEWYPRYGSMQDWLYADAGSIHLDLVVSPHLRPLPQRLVAYWEQNREALMAWLRTAASLSLRGTVRDAETGQPIPDAMVLVRDANDRGRHLLPLRVHPETGRFARFLVPGRYALRAEAPGYHTQAAEHEFALTTASATGAGGESKHYVELTLRAATR